MTSSPARSIEAPGSAETIGVYSSTVSSLGTPVEVEVVDVGVTVVTKVEVETTVCVDVDTPDELVVELVELGPEVAAI